MADAPVPDAKATTNRMVMIFIFILALFVMFDPSLRAALGGVVGLALNPLWGFSGDFPVATLFITGMFMTGTTITVRHFFTDYVKQAESQKMIGAFNKEMRQARLDNNTYKLKKMTEQQPRIMKASMAQTTTQLKLMPVTMLIVIPIFAWLAVFIGDLDSTRMSVPWSNLADLNTSYLFPAWILLYSLISLPFGQLLSRGLRYFSFKKRLDALTAAGK